MSFWTTDDGSAITVDKDKVDTGNSFSLIPDNTNCLVRIDDAEWTEYQGVKYIRVKAIVVKPSALEGRKVGKSLYVTEPRPDWKEEDRGKEFTKARTALFKMDVHAKGKLSANGGIPSDEQLKLNLVGAQQMWTMGIFTPKGGDPIQYIKAINGKGKVEVTEPKAAPKPRPAPAFDEDLDDDVPF